MDRRKAITVVAILRTLWGISFAQAESDCAKLAQGALSAGPIVLMYHDIVPDGTLPGLEKADRCKVLSMISEPTPLQACPVPGTRRQSRPTYWTTPDLIAVS